MRPLPGDLVTFSSLIGEDRGPCLVIAVDPILGFKSESGDTTDIGAKVLFLTPRCRLLTRELFDGSASMTSDEWLRKLAPGTLLYSKLHPPLGFCLVYHAEVHQFPGPWTQVIVHVVNSQCRLCKHAEEAGNFLERWSIIDVPQ